MNEIILIILAVIFAVLLYYKYNIYENYDNNSITKYNLPKNMWSFWDNETLPDEINLIHENRKKKLEPYGWKLHILNNKTVHDFIDLTNLPENFDKLIIQHKADYYRLLLLKKYGGIWIDASIIINDPNAIEKLYNDSLKINSEFTGFTLDPGADSTDRSKYIENWFIMAPLNSEIINKWLDEFIFAINKGLDNYIPYAKTEGVIIVDRISTYLTQHACMQTVLQKRLGRPANIILNDSENDMFKIQTDCNWDFNCLLKKFNENADEVRKIPYIKLRGGERDFEMNKYFELKEYFAIKEYFSNNNNNNGNRIGWAN